MFYEFTCAMIHDTLSFHWIYINSGCINLSNCLDFLQFQKHLFFPFRKINFPISLTCCFPTFCILNLSFSPLDPKKRPSDILPGWYSPGWCLHLHLYLWLFWGGSWIFMGLALKWLMWPVLMHCFGLPGQGTKKGMVPKYCGGWEKPKDFLFNDTSGKYISAQHWQSTMSCSGQTILSEKCEMQWNCSICDWFELDTYKTFGPYIKKNNSFPKEFNQSQLSVPSQKTYLVPSKKKRVEKWGSFSWKTSIHKNDHWRPLCLVVGRGHGSEQHLAVLPRLKEMLPLPMSRLGWKVQNQLVVNKSDAWDIQIYNGKICS